MEPATSPFNFASMLDNPRLNPPPDEDWGKPENRFAIPVRRVPHARPGDGQYIGANAVSALTGLTARQLTRDRLVAHGWLEPPVQGYGDHLCWDAAQVEYDIAHRFAPPPSCGRRSYLCDGVRCDVEFREGRARWIRAQGDVKPDDLERVARLAGGRWVWLDEPLQGGFTLQEWGRW